MTAATDLHRAPDGPGVLARARSRPLVPILSALFVIFIATLVLTSRPEDTTTLSIDNSAEDGTRAVAQILRAQGVDVRQTPTMAGARIDDPSRTTLVLADAGELMDYQIDAVADYPGDIALIRPGQDLLAALETGLTADPTLDAEVQSAQCADADAIAAESVATLDTVLSGGDSGGAELCFVNADGAGAYAVIDGERRVSVLGSWPIITNDHLDEHGHAALSLRMLGRHETLVWYVGDPYDVSTLTWEGSSGDGKAPPTEVEANPDFLPPGTIPVLFILALTVAVAAMWRARRFGRLVREPLPVEVRASESTRGRARLYRRARASGRAAAAMRARAALRMGRRLGVPRSADRAAIVGAIARAAERDPRDVDRILYGAAPTTDAQLMTTIDELDTLEREVHRP
ncbi:DUF4350 domain-containing protein [Demequina sp. NBRC 110053]|uniref:DUF4350 domain-containing protein n=1 Tax=Demequina sp. NBRC 110053 TaxID=1570342 RepID=UPI00135655A3|nr:DUF4350 domain-containing protein [Demequina sp. NBRC 110053]